MRSEANETSETSETETDPVVSVDTGYSGGEFAEDDWGNVGLIGIGIDESEWNIDSGNCEEAAHTFSSREGVGSEHDECTATSLQSTHATRSSEGCCYHHTTPLCSENFVRNS